MSIVPNAGGRRAFDRLWTRERRIIAGVNARRQQIVGPKLEIREQSEEILRSLPQWFGIEEGLLHYAEATGRLPTFAVMDEQAAIGFITLAEHFPESWEVHCIAVHASHRGQGHGRALLEHAEDWLKPRGVRFLQVKTVAADRDDAAYAETRGFYARVGFVPLQVFPELWGTHNPCLQMIKVL